MTGACDECLRRTDLIAALAGRLDIEWRRRSAPAAVLSLPDAALLALEPTGSMARRYDRFDPARARARIADRDLVAACRCSDDYPARLLELPDPPAVLHIAGDRGALAEPLAVAVVGARRGTPYGVEVARALGRGLGAAGVPVVSGLALGVDAAAHAGALEVGARAAVSILDVVDRERADRQPPCAGSPVAVLAGGADMPYPASSRSLYRAVRERGCVVSELPPGFGPRRWAFVARNRLIAALAAITVVVEATERSGSLTTADFAGQAGRVVGAVPGPVNSRFSTGTNALLATGASLIRDTRDVLDELLGPGAAARLVAAPAQPTLEPQLRDLLDAIERGRGTLAELAATADESRRVLGDLTELELSGLVKRDLAGRYVRAHSEGR